MLVTAEHADQQVRREPPNQPGDGVDLIAGGSLPPAVRSNCVPRTSIQASQSRASAGGAAVTGGALVGNPACPSAEKSLSTRRSPPSGDARKRLTLSCSLALCCASGSASK